MNVFHTDFFFNDTAPAEIYTLSLHDALPICPRRGGDRRAGAGHHDRRDAGPVRGLDRKSTRLNSSHGYISYAVFCLKKKTIFSLTSFSPRQSSSTTIERVYVRVPLTISCVRI